MSICLVMSSNHLILCCPLLLLPQSFPASGSLPMSQFFTSDDQNVGVLDSASVLPMNIQGWFPLWWTGLISLQSKGLSRVFSNKQQFFGAQLLYSPTLLTTKQNLRWEQKSYRVALDNHSLSFYCPLAAPWPLLPYRKTERLKGTLLPPLSCKMKILFPHFSFNLSWPCLYKTLLFSTHKGWENLKKCSQGNNWLNLVEDPGCRWIPT